MVPTSAGESTGWYWWNLRKVNFFLTHYNKAELSQEKKMLMQVKLISLKLGNTIKKFFILVMYLG